MESKAKKDGLKKKEARWGLPENLCDFDAGLDVGLEAWLVLA